MNAFYNAGRRSKRGRQFPLGDPELMRMGSKDLASLGTQAAVAELARRGRDASGRKLAWSKAKTNAWKKIRSNMAGRPARHGLPHIPAEDLEMARMTLKQLKHAAKFKTARGARARAELQRRTSSRAMRHGIVGHPKQQFPKRKKRKGRKSKTNPRLRDPVTGRFVSLNNPTWW